MGQNHALSLTSIIIDIIFAILLYAFPLSNIGFQTTKADSVSDIVEEFRNNDNGNNEERSVINNNDDEDDDNDLEDVINKFTDDNNGNNNDNDERSVINNNDDEDSADRVREIIDRFTNEGNNNEPTTNDDDTEASEQGTQSERESDRFNEIINRFTDYTNNPSTNNPSASPDVVIQSHEDGEDDPILDPAHRVGTGVIENSRGLANSLIPPGLENTKERVNSGLDRAQTALDTAIERAKYRISGSLPSGSGFN